MPRRPPAARLDVRRAARLGPNGGVVLNFHSISTDPRSLSGPLSPDTFNELVGWLARHFRVGTLESLAGSHEHDNRPFAVLSFDDGYRDFLDYAMPILAQHGVSANQNIVPGCVESGQPPWTVLLLDRLARLPSNRMGALRLPGFTAPSPDSSRDARVRFGVLLSRFLKLRPREERLPLIEELTTQVPELAEGPSIPMLSKQDLGEVARHHEIGLHSYEHDSMGFESDEFFRQDVERCMSWSGESPRRYPGRIRIPEWQPPCLADRDRPRQRTPRRLACRRQALPHRDPCPSAHYGIRRERDRGPAAHRQGVLTVRAAACVRSGRRTAGRSRSSARAWRAAATSPRSATKPSSGTSTSNGAELWCSRRAAGLRAPSRPLPSEYASGTAGFPPRTWATCSSIPSLRGRGFFRRLHDGLLRELEREGVQMLTVRPGPGSEPLLRRAFGYQTLFPFKESIAALDEEGLRALPYGRSPIVRRFLPRAQRKSRALPQGVTCRPARLDGLETPDPFGGAWPTAGTVRDEAWLRERYGAPPTPYEAAVVERTGPSGGRPCAPRARVSGRRPKPGMDRRWLDRHRGRGPGRSAGG